jgi:hypothetical protein
MHYTGEGFKDKTDAANSSISNSKFQISEEALIWNPKFGIWRLEDYWDSVSSSNTIAWNGQLAMQMPHSMQMVTSISFLSGPSLMALSWQLGMQAPH